MEILDYDKIFNINVKMMRLNYSHPEIKRDIKCVLKCLIVHGIFTFIFCVVIYNIIFLNLKTNDFSQTCRNGVLGVVYCVVTLSFYIMIWRQNQLNILIGMMRKDFEFCNTLPQEDRVLIKDYAYKGKWVLKQFLVIAVCTFCCFPFKSIGLMIFNAVTSEFKFIQVYELQFPEVIEKNKDCLIVFLLIYIVMLYYGFYASVMYLAFVPLGPMFMLHACGQLELVRRRVDKLFSEGDKEVRREILAIAKQLQYIYSFVELINDCFRVAYELTLKATTIILPITCYEVIESIHRGEVSLEFLTFIFGGSSLSSFPCYYSDLLIEKGEEVRMAIYTCGWERDYNRDARATIIIMMTRAQRPVAVRTMFRTVCLDELTELFQQSYAIFNLMNAVWK